MALQNYSGESFIRRIRKESAEGVRQEAANLSGKRTEHDRCMFYSLEELMEIGSFLFAKNLRQSRNAACGTLCTVTGEV